jgi:DNA replication and repair protein RecF
MEFDPRFTLISGPNASGKTSLLEALYVLGRGRSFRTRRLEHLIRRGRERFTVFGEIDLPARRIPLGVEGRSEGIRARVGGAPAASLAELALIFPVQIIDPEVHKLIEEGPGRRRRFLDWGVFHVEPSFIPSWQRYQQSLKQRNAALKSGQPRAIVSAWDHELTKCALEITQARSAYLQRLMDMAQALARRLLGCELLLIYRQGWSRELSFEEALIQCWKLDAERRVTQVGPHRAEIVIQLDGMTAKDRISRGQQKLLAAALLIAQIELFPADAAARPTLLLDDPAAELDDTHLGQLIAELAGGCNQLIVTSLQGEFRAFGSPGRRYLIAEGALHPG